jgi:hypothetical protein
MKGFLVNSNTLIVQFFGGPGCRKSTLAASVFAKLKWLNINCEQTGEYAKDKVWEQAYTTLDDQIYVFGQQHHRIWRLLDKTDVIVCDSPLLLSMVYDKTNNEELHKLCLKTYCKWNNLNYFVNRQAKFNPIGRIQNEEQSKVKDEEIRNILITNNIEYQVVDGNEHSINKIVNDVLWELEQDGKYNNI